MHTFRSQFYEILDAPKIDAKSAVQNVMSEAGMNVTLTCPVTGYPAPKITWYRREDNRSVPVAKTERYTILKLSSSLLISGNSSGIFSAEPWMDTSATQD